MDKVTIKSSKGKLILFVTILASGMGFLDGSVVNIAIPKIQSTLHATLTDIQWVVNSYMLMLAALILISGALGDKYGRKKIFTYGIFVFTIASFLCSISGSIPQLIIFRAIQGIGAAMMIPGSLSIIHTSFDDKVRGKAIGIWSGFSGGVAALGPFVGGFLVQTFNWPSIFYINIPLGILALFLTVKYVPESKNMESRKLDILGTVFIFVALCGLAYGLISGPMLGWRNSMVVASIVLGVVTLTAFVFTERKVKEPLMPIEIFKSPLVTGANLATLFLYFALSGVIFFLVLNFQQLQQYSPLYAGMGMLPTILIITFLSSYGGTIADKYGPRIPMIVGPLIVSLGMLLLILPGTHANYFVSYLPGLILFGLGMALVIAPLTKSALAVDHKYSGAASGVNNAVARIAGLLAVALLGAVAVSLFTAKLHSTMSQTHLPPSVQQQMMKQADRYGGLEVPSTLDQQTKQKAEKSFEDAFLYSFRIAMAVNAGLAFLSAVVAFLTIHNPKRK